MKAYTPFSFSLGQEDATYKQLVTQQLVSRGTGTPPDPPREVRATPGSRGALLTWSLPASGAQWIRGFRIYKDKESNLVSEVQDPGRRQLYVNLSSGAEPPVTNFFVSAIGQAGAESAKIQVQAVAIAEAGAPAIPPAPPEYGDTGGNDTGYYGSCPLSGAPVRLYGQEKWWIKTVVPCEDFVVLVTTSGRTGTFSLSDLRYTIKGLRRANELAIGDVMLTEDGDERLVEARRVKIPGATVDCYEASEGHVYSAWGFIGHNKRDSSP